MDRAWLSGNGCDEGLDCGLYNSYYFLESIVDTPHKLEVLGQAARYDLCGSCFCRGKSAHLQSGLGRWIYPALMPDAKEILLLKVLMSNACENNCGYCINRSSLNYHRTSFSPEGLARLFVSLWRARRVQGLFLSSAVEGSAEQTMARMLAAVEILRFRYQFKGYIHLKILPGAGFSAVEQAVRLADRVSINLEAPNRQRLQKIAPKKDFDNDLLLRMGWVRQLREMGGARAGQTTQFVVGAADESDKEILTTTARLYKDMKLRRVYFSAFQPVEGTPLDDHPATPILREHRLYQADLLLRRYGFKLEEIGLDPWGNLPLSLDPKLIWAYSHPERFPIEVNTAPKEELLRIPGIGPISAQRILKERRKGKIRSLADIEIFGTVIKRGAPYLLLDGKRPEGSTPQLELWQPEPTSP